jgi:hypothetical protein
VILAGLVITALALGALIARDTLSPSASQTAALPAKARAAGQAQCSPGGSTVSGAVTQLTDSTFVSTIPSATPTSR